jgi:CRP/FNR family cyclic AMP-dependent transcriptional regulator
LDTGSEGSTGHRFPRRASAFSPVEKERVMIMQIVAWIASVLVFSAFFMKTMVPLRIVAICSNIVFIGYALIGLHYGIFGKVYPIFLLHISLLPLNVIRLYQIKKLIRKIREVSTDEDSVGSLIPYMQKETYAKGRVLFSKGDFADRIYFIQQGTVAIPEINKRLAQGTVFGEVGVFTAYTKRSASAICDEESEIYSIHRDKVIELYYQNPKFGFFIVHLLSRYASENVDTILELQRRV